MAGPPEKYQLRPIKILLREYGPLTTRELSEITGQEITALQVKMDTMTANGEADGLPVHGGEYWS